MEIAVCLKQSEIAHDRTPDMLNCALNIHVFRQVQINAVPRKGIHLVIHLSFKHLQHLCVWDFNQFSLLLRKNDFQIYVEVFYGLDVVLEHAFRQILIFFIETQEAGN